MANGNGSSAAAQRIQWMVGIMAIIMLAGVPWAFSLHGNVASMNTRLDAMERQMNTIKVPPEWFKDQVDKNTADIEDLKNR